MAVNAMQRPALAARLRIGGLVVRVACAHLKPVGWVREGHPAFVCDGPSELDVDFTYADDIYDERGFGWVRPDAVREAPVVTREGRVIRVASSYYDARLDGGRAEVRLASGFRPEGPLRTLCALVLPARGVLLLRAALEVDGAHASLVLGPPAARRAVAPGAFDGWIAVGRRGEQWHAAATPLDDAADPTTETSHEWPLAALRFVGDSAVPGPLTPAEVAGRLLAHACVVDREAAAVARLLNLAAQLTADRPACLEEADPGARD